MRGQVKGNQMKNATALSYPKTRQCDIDGEEKRQEEKRQYQMLRNATSDRQRQRAPAQGFPNQEKPCVLCWRENLENRGEENVIMIMLHDIKSKQDVCRFSSCRGGGGVAGG